jgi:DNA end-binding protein Ku
MAARPTWQGHLRLSLVSCPVALYTATSKASDVSFHLLNPKTNNRIRMVTTDPDTGPVERSDLVKGYEVEKDRYIVLTEAEIESVRLESTKTLDIERFVDVADIDRLYWNDPYFLVPDGKVAAEAYGVIRDAMAKAKKIALGRLVLHTRERLFALEPRDDGIIAWTLRSTDEVRDVAAAFDDIPSVKTDPKMLDIAAKIIEQQEGPFDPSMFTDRYEEALKALIAEKEEGHKPVAAPKPEDTKVSDLMEALRASLGKGGGKAAATPARKAAPAKARRSTPAKTARRKAS